jgi:hypothetical protein
VLAYDDEERAKDALGTAEHLREEGVIRLASASVVRRREHGAVEFTEAGDVSGRWRRKTVKSATSVATTGSSFCSNGQATQSRNASALAAPKSAIVPRTMARAQANALTAGK